MPSLRTVARAKRANPHPTDPLDVLQTARVPLRTLIKHGEICLDTLVRSGPTSYRFVVMDADGKVSFHTATGAVGFLELSHSLGLEPWAACDPGEVPEPMFVKFAGPLRRDGFVEYVDGYLYDWEAECVLYVEPIAESIN